MLKKVKPEWDESVEPFTSKEGGSFGKVGKKSVRWLVNNFNLFPRWGLERQYLEKEAEQMEHYSRGFLSMVM
jgi:hypothetical protein